MSANEHFSNPGRAPDHQGSPASDLASDFQSLLDRVAEHISEAEHTLPDPRSDRPTVSPSASEEAAHAIRSVQLVAGVVPASSVGFAGDGHDRAGDYRQADPVPATEIPIVLRSPPQEGVSDSFNPSDAIEAWIAQAAPRHPSVGSRVASDTGYDSVRLTLIEERLAQIAHLMGEIVGIVAKRSGEDGLSSVEAKLSAIGSRLDAMHAGASSAVDLEQRFSELTDRISRRHVAALTAQSEAIGREISSVAGAVAEHISSKLVLASDRIAAQERRLEDVQACIEKFVGDQQQIAARTHTLLDATQQIAMGLLERMDGLERDETRTERQNVSADRHTVRPPAARYVEPDFTTPADVSSAISTVPRALVDSPEASLGARLLAMSRDDAADGGSCESFPSDDLERDIQGLANSWDAAFAPAGPEADASRNQNTLDWAPGWPPSAPRELASFPALTKLANDQDEPAATIADAAGPQFLDFNAGPEPAAASASRKRRPGLLFTAIAFLLSIAGLAYTIVNLPAPLEASRGRSASRAVVGPQVQQPLPSPSPSAAAADDADEAAASPLVPGRPSQGGDAAAEPAGQHNTEPLHRPEPRLKLDNVPETEASGRGFAGPHAHAVPEKAGGKRLTAEPSRFATTGVRERSIEAEAMAAMFGPGSTSVVVTGATALSLSGTLVRPPVEDLPAAIGPQALRLAAEAGDPSAEFEIGVRFAQGQGVAQNFQMAFQWYERAAGRGLAIAQYRLGTLYEIGLGVPADAAKARDLYRESALQGNVRAMHDLSALNVREGADRASWSEALYWLKHAAAHGLAESQLSLGGLYESGEGVPKDAKLAYVWFALAARSGEKEAATRRDRVLRQLAADDAREARELVVAFRPKSTLALTNDARVAGDAWKARQASATRGPG